MKVLILTGKFGMGHTSAAEALREEMLVRQVRVEYKRSAVLGDMICPRTAREEERTVVELCSAEGKPYAVVELTGEKRC